jgi:hypothetical protein
LRKGAGLAHEATEKAQGRAEAAALYRRDGLVLAWAHAIRHVADMWLDDAEFANAQPLYEEALEAYRGSLGTQILDLANTLRPYALLLEATGNWEAAGEMWREAKSLYASLRMRAGVAEFEAHLRRARF